METETLTLTDFLLARIAEDEAVYADVNRWYKNRNWTSLCFGLGSWTVFADGTEPVFETVSTTEPGGAYARFATHIDPLRLRRECEAKRWIVERVGGVIEHYAPFEREWEWCPKARSEPYGDLEWGADAECECNADAENARGGSGMLRAIALPYAGHPDYRQEWKP